MESETKAKHDSMLSSIAGTNGSEATLRAAAIISVQKEACAAYRAAKAVKSRNGKKASHYDVCKATMTLLGPAFLDRLLISSAPDATAADLGKAAYESSSMAAAYSGMASRTGGK